MAYIIAGLGNPGDDYTSTRHNTGRIILESVRKKYDFPDWEKDKKSNALISKGKISNEAVTLVEPETYMNKSGSSVAYFVKNKKQAENLIVIHDDLDLPTGTAKFSFNKSAGGHNGVASIIKAIKTQEFIRIRVGIAPTTPSGKIKKPSGEAAVEKHILGEFKKPELDALKKIAKKTIEVLGALADTNREIAMGEFNSK
jgi:PTH1 family peptidyl-tRNA hydrolase